MQLYIVRHGIAIDREDPKSPPDPDRYLTEEGIERTRQVAKGIVALGATADLLMSSPYVRAVQTAEIFAAALEYPKEKIRRTDLLLPGSEASLFFRELAKDKHSSTIFCFGHAPQLDDLIAAGLGSDRPHRLLGGDHFGRLALADADAGQGRLPKHPAESRGPARRRPSPELLRP